MAIQYLPPVAIEGHQSSGSGGPDHPMRIATRRAAGLDSGGWTSELRKEVGKFFDAMSGEWHTRTSPQRTAVVMGRDRSIPATEPPVSNADGIVLDAEGRVYALTEAGIEVIKADGQHLGVIPVWCITRRCQNLTFGGPDKRTLYVAGGGTLLRMPMLSRGFGGRAK